MKHVAAKILKMLIASIVLYLLVAFLFNNFYAFHANFGNLWVNVENYIVIIFGGVILYLCDNYSKFKTVFSVIILSILVIVLLDSYKNINALLGYLLLIALWTYRMPIKAFVIKLLHK